MTKKQVPASKVVKKLAANAVAEKAVQDKKVEAFLADFKRVAKKHGFDFAPVLVPASIDIAGQKATLANSVMAVLKVVPLEPPAAYGEKNDQSQ